MFEISRVADILINCSFEEAWEKLMHPAITTRFSFDEVKEYIDTKIRKVKCISLNTSKTKELIEDKFYKNIWKEG